MKIVIKADGKSIRLRLPLKMITWKLFYKNTYMNKSDKKEKADSNDVDGVSQDISIDVTDNYTKEDDYEEEDDMMEDDFEEESDSEMVEENSNNKLDAKEMRKTAIAIYKELKKYKKANGKLVLVDVESADGEIVKIII